MSDLSSPNAVLSTRNLCYSIGSERILDNISLTIQAGKVTGLLGPNGSGKTTLLKILLGIYVPSGGAINLDDTIKRGVVFQNTEQNLLPWKTALQNITLPYLREEERVLLTLGKEAIDLLKRFDLEGIKDKYPSELSGGQQQIVSIVRWLIRPPRLLIMDEGGSMLDILQKERTHKLIRSVVDFHGTSIFLVSHSPSELALLCDYVYLLSNSPGTIIDSIEIDRKKSFSFNDELLWQKTRNILPPMPKVSS